MSGLTDSADAPDLAIAPARIAEALAVQAVLTGTVSEYGYQHGLHEEPVVGINLRLIRTSDQPLSGQPATQLLAAAISAATVSTQPRSE